VIPSISVLNGGFFLLYILVNNCCISPIRYTAIKDRFVTESKSMTNFIFLTRIGSCRWRWAYTT